MEARRRAARKKKLKSIGKSKSTDTEEEQEEDEMGDDGKTFEYKLKNYLLTISYLIIRVWNLC